MNDPGTNFGDDWSSLADLVLPHPQIHYDAEFYLGNKVQKLIL